MDGTRWTDATWLAGANAWVEEQPTGLGLTRTGEVEQPHVAPWSTVLRVPTDAGAVFFEANDDRLEGVIAWGVDDVEDSVDTAPFRDAYLAPWAERLPGVDLAAAVVPALRLGWAVRAINGHVAEDGDRTRTRLRMFLDGRA